LKTRNKQKSQKVKLLAKEDKNTRKCQKESKKSYLHKNVRHRGNDDSHRATMGTTWRPRNASKSSDYLKQICLHRCHDGSEAHY
jgi:hypothetical protein